MPILDWIGKDKVINHHNDVPYRVLNHIYSYDKNGERRECSDSGNKIIHGDNLSVMKSLLPAYEGKVKCIYIDPPYNTGNEGWVYNDNVNDHKIKRWLGEVVGKEGEDLSRHDKWLCMMYPRLKLMYKLLDPDGVIFISIDDNELYNLKLICDEIFGANCFVANISWQRTYSMRNDSKGVASEVEHILVYSKEPDWQPQKLPRTEAMDAKYKNIDDDPQGAWRNIIASAPSASTHQGMVYAIQHPFTGELVYPPSGRCWPLQQSQMFEIMNDWCEYELRNIQDEEKRTSICNVNNVREGVLAIMLKQPIEVSKERARIRYEQGAWPEFFFTKNGYGSIGRKAYLGKVGGRPVTNFWSYDETGHTDEAARLLKNIFDGNSVFDTPKPPRLIERILNIIGDKNAIVFDAFAGSATTAQAVIEKNKQDNGNRKFIIVESMDYAEPVTATRVKKVISGYGSAKNHIEGIDSAFDFYELGEALFTDNNYINETLNRECIEDYIWYSETKKVRQFTDKKYYLGTSDEVAYYFFYEKNKVCILDYKFLSMIDVKESAYVVYADKCTLSQDELTNMNITFKKIPRDIMKI